MEPSAAVHYQEDVVHEHLRSSMIVRYRQRSSSSSSLSVSVCSNSSNVSSFPAPPAPAPRSSWRLAADEAYEDYEVVFTEEKLGLTLKSQDQQDPAGYRIPVTIVKSTIFSVGQVSHQIREGDMLQSVNGESIANLDFRDVLRILKIAPRPIRLRFRTKYTQRGFRRAWTFPANELEASSSSSSRRSGTGTFDSDLRVALAAGSFTLPDRSDPLVDHDDSDSQGAVLSESFGDADSTRTTENSSVVTDFTETNQTSTRQSSRLAAFLRKPFRRNDGFDGGRWEMRMGIVPASPRAEIALESPCKAAVHVYWRVHPKALSYHVQYSRDWTMKVWKTWAGRPRRVSENEHELTTTIFGLDYAKSYVMRVRYELDGSYAPAEWSAPSATVITVGLGQVDAARHGPSHPRARRG